MMSSCRDPQRGSFWTYSETRTTDNLLATSRLLKGRALQSSTSNQMLVYNILWILAASLVLRKLYNTHSGLVSGHVYISLGLVKESFIKRNPSDFLDLRLDCLRLPFLPPITLVKIEFPCSQETKKERMLHTSFFFFFCNWQMLLGSSNQEISSKPKMF